MGELLVKNRLTALFQSESDRILSVYFTAGYPKLGDTRMIMEALQDGGADIIEIGIPFSDPIADGPTIQESSKNALENGMTMSLMFEQIRDMREKVDIPVVLMGYLNPVIQYGIERFSRKCNEIGIDGLILPDLPLFEYEHQYQAIFSKYGLSNVFLVTPQTTEERIRKIDHLTDSFIYLVSSSSTTGAKSGLSDNQELYFERIQNLNLSSPQLIGFGISNAESFERVCRYSSGAIIGSAFIDMLKNSNDIHTDVVHFIKEIKRQS